jgi:hypothetical protein
MTIVGVELIVTASAPTVFGPGWEGKMLAIAGAARSWALSIAIAAAVRKVAGREGLSPQTPGLFNKASTGNDQGISLEDPGPFKRPLVPLRDTPFLASSRSLLLPSSGPIMTDTSSPIILAVSPETAEANRLMIFTIALLLRQIECETAATSAAVAVGTITGLPAKVANPATNSFAVPAIATRLFDVRTARDKDVRIWPLATATHLSREIPIAQIQFTAFIKTAVDAGRIVPDTNTCWTLSSNDDEKADLENEVESAHWQYVVRCW